MERTFIGDLKEHVGKEVLVNGWVHKRRDHGKLIFLDLRDETGLVQAVVTPSQEVAHKTASEVRSEWVVEAKALVKERPEKMINAELKNGTIEIEVLDLRVFNEATTPVFDIETDGYEVKEEIRLENRYLDLRRNRLQKNIRMRHLVVREIRDFLSDRGFVEIETPILTKSTPEGARDYIVPSRVEPGNIYALPQSPQQYKQLLMASGFEKYFQIARCFRDEDTRGDRQPEFTQLDLEMAFVEREDIMALNEALLIHLVEKLLPEKKITEKPFPLFTYAEAMEKYGIDRPDIRENKEDPNELGFCWVTDFPFFEKREDGGWTFTHNPFSRAVLEHEELLLTKQEVGKIITSQYDVALNGSEIGGGSIRNHNPKALRAVFEIMGMESDYIDANFGHMLKAMGSGTPPHGGIAWGLERLLTMLLGELNIREFMAFPKNGEGRDPMMGAPSPVVQDQLKELGLKQINPEE